MTHPWVRRIGIASVALVAVVAAVVSYSHMHDVAEHAGEGWRAWIEPLSVDGLLVGASLVVSIRPKAWLAWVAVAVGILVSLAANLAAAQPDLVSRLVAAWPAVALALSYETLLTLVRHGRGKTPESAVDRLSVPSQADEYSVLLAQARQAVHQARAEGRRFGRPRLMRELGVSEGTARRLLTTINKESTLHVVHGIARR